MLLAHGTQVRMKRLDALRVELDAQRRRGHKHLKHTLRQAMAKASEDAGQDGEARTPCAAWCGCPQP